MLLERRTRSTIWDSKEPASCSLHCIHGGLQSKFTYFMRTLESFEDLWRLRWPNPRGDRRLTSPNTIRSKGAPPYWFAWGRHSGTRSRRARRTWLTVWSPTAVCCFYVNNSTARRFYYHIQHVHGGRREFHGRVKKTTSSLENCVGEIENGRYWFHSTLSDLLQSVNQSRDKGLSSWLTAVPLVDQRLVLNKQEFSAFKLYYYSFKIFPRSWLAKSTRLTHHNQLLMTKFGRILTLTRKWRQKYSVFAG